jgi:hypothetical protein
MQGLDVIEHFDEPLALAPITEIGDYMPPKPRSHDPRTDVRGTVAFPLTEQIASDLKTHGEEWTRAYHTDRGVSRWELDILIAGAKAYG